MAPKNSAPDNRASDHSPSETEESPIQVTESQVLDILTAGKLVEQGLLPYSSNHSFLVTAEDEELVLPAVYKPRRGENPLWDFEWGTLCLREAAAYQISTILDWHLVPPTVLREGSYGIGSVQLYIPNDEDEHYFTIQADARFAQALRRLALFDYVINNADRKSGHCLVGDDGQLWAIDHGICFHTEYKLRTVIWEFGHEPIDDDLLDDLNRLKQQLCDEHSDAYRTLEQLLSRAEQDSLLSRTQALLTTRTYPAPLAHWRNYPWPPI